MTKKNEIHYEKTVKQLEAMTPTEIKTIILGIPDWLTIIVPNPFRFLFIF